MVTTPTLDKMHAVHERSQAIGEFLEWLEGKDLHLGEYHKHSDTCYEPHDHRKAGTCPLFGDCDVKRDRFCGMNDQRLYLASYNVEKLLAEFFEIDLEAAEREKRAILADLRRQNRGGQ